MSADAPIEGRSETEFCRRPADPKSRKENMHSEYPRFKYHLTKTEVIVNNPDEDAALGLGWANTPAAFDPYRVPSPARRDCLRWVDECPVPNLSWDHRTRIKTHLLRADAAFCKSPDDLSTAEDCMRRAFAGVAEVLWDAGILSEQLLKNEIPDFVWDTTSGSDTIGCGGTKADTRQTSFGV
jgi:hypothetical protein